MGKLRPQQHVVVMNHIGIELIYLPGDCPPLREHFRCRIQTQIVRAFVWQVCTQLTRLAVEEEQVGIDPAAALSYNQIEGDARSTAGDQVIALANM